VEKIAMRKQHSVTTIVAWTLLIVLGLVSGFAVHQLWQFRTGVERLADRLTLDVGPESTLLYDANNNLVSALFEEHRMSVSLDDMSPHMTNAVLVTEDRRFFDHDGIDIRRIAASAVANQRAGEIVQGGSTITQQLVRSILLDREQTYSRKLKEVILARRLEEMYGKRPILEAYLNRVYFGDGYYGVEAAAVGYFGKSATDLDAAESATLAGLIKGPSIYSPTKAPDKARERRDWVLGEMKSEGMLSDQEFQAAVSVPVKTLLARGESRGVEDLRHARGAEYFRDAVSRELIEQFGAEAVYTGGLRVYTTLDRGLQRIAEEVVESRLKGTPRGGRDPLQGALVAIDPRTGYVRALVGGRSFRESSFNRAIDARRQPGSAFKPFVYAMAIESGYSPGTLLENLDQPIPTRQGPWLPSGEHEVNTVSLREGLVNSSNRAAVHLLQQVGVNRTLDLVNRFGITSKMPSVPSVALGTGEVTLVELTSAYGVFANRGVWKSPTLIRRVVDRYGRELYAAPQTERPVISEATAYLMTSMMSDVIDHGTATTARSNGFTLRAAGKTGTSQDYADAWFVGFTPSLVTGVWFGHDQPKTIMNRGFASVVAVPAWARFMRAALSGVNDQWFEMPGTLVKVKLCRLSGQLATERCLHPVYEPPTYDPTNPGIVTASATVTRSPGVYEEVRSYGRVPGPCTLNHGHSDALAGGYTGADPSLTRAYDPAPYSATPTPTPAPYPATSPTTSSVSVLTPSGATYTPPPLPPNTPPVAQPPPFMTNRPRTVIMPATANETPAAAPPPTATTPAATPTPPAVTPTPPAAAPAPKPVPTTPETEPENPIIPGSKVTTKPTPPEQDPASAPIVPGTIPGTKIDKTPPRPPGNQTPPGM
jgi:1A family penicillin-binding protein